MALAGARSFYVGVHSEIRERRADLPCIDGGQDDGAHGGEDEEAQTGTLGSGPPFVFPLEIDERIEREAKLEDRQAEHDHEDDARE